MPLRKVSCIALAACAACAHATTIDFEEVTINGCRAFPSPGYQGFDWTGDTGDQSWVISDARVLPFFPGVSAHSGTNYAWSNGYSDIELTSADGSLFTLTSVWSRGGNFDVSYTAHGYRNGIEVVRRPVQTIQTYAFEPFYFQNVDRVVFDGQASNLLIDHIIVNVVPEPPAIGLLLAGLGLMGMALRRRTIAGA